MRISRKVIYLAGFVFSLPIALASYINSSFISSFVSERTVGLIYVLGSAGSILALLLATRIFRKMGEYRFLLLVALLDALSFLVMALVKNAWAVVAMFILGFSMNVLIVFSLDELLKIFSKDTATGEIRGFYLTICNLAWVFSQLAFGTFLGGLSFRSIYLISFSIMLLFFLLSFFKLKNVSEPNYDRIRTFKYVGNFFRNKNLFRAYGISFLLQFFYCWMVIYTPIYLYLHLGFNWKEIGIIFTVMLLPFVLIEFPLGKYSDKVGERYMLMLGFGIISIATIALFFTKGHLIWLWAMLLFFTRAGAAMVEVMSDVYFFKHIEPENEEFVRIYRNASPTAYILGPILASLVFLYIPSFNFIYVILGILMLSGIYISSRIKRGDI